MDRKIFGKEHGMFRKSFKQYIKDKILPFYNDWEDAGITPREIWLDAGKKGFLCPTAEEKYGGPGGDFLYSTVITEEMYYYGVSSLFFPLHNDIVFPYIELYANEEQKKDGYPDAFPEKKFLLWP